MGLANLQAMNDAGMQNEGYEFSDWIVLEWIARRTKDGKTAPKYFTRNFMLSDLPMSESTLKRSLKRLERKGTISVQRLKRYEPAYRLAITCTRYLEAVDRKADLEQSPVTLHTRFENGHAAHSNGHAAHSLNGNGHAAHSPEARKEVRAVKEVKAVKERERPPGGGIGDLSGQGQNLNGNGKTGARSETNAVPVSEAVSPPSPPVADPPPSPKERFNELAAMLPAHAHNVILAEIKAEIADLEGVKEKDAAVSVWCDRIEAGNYGEYLNHH